MKDTPTASPSFAEEVREAFAMEKKLTVTPRDHLTPIEIVIRPFYVDQALEVVDQIQTIYEAFQSKADAQGNVDLFDVFKSASEDVLTIVCKITNTDRSVIGKLELDDLLRLFAEIF